MPLLGRLFERDLSVAFTQCLLWPFGDFWLKLHLLVKILWFYLF